MSGKQVQDGQDTPIRTDAEILAALKRDPVLVRVDPEVARNLNFSGSLGEAFGFMDALLGYENQEGEAFSAWVEDPSAVDKSQTTTLAGTPYPSVARQIEIKGTNSFIRYNTRKGTVQFQNIGLKGVPVDPGDYGLVYSSAW